VEVCQIMFKHGIGVEGNAKFALNRRTYPLQILPE